MRSCLLPILLVLLGFALLLLGLHMAPRGCLLHLPLARPRRQTRNLLGLAAVCFLALTLYGCGTLPLPAMACPPVPAELLQEPQEPVLLTPAEPSTTPGTTKPSTPSAAQKTERDTGR